MKLLPLNLVAAFPLSFLAGAISGLAGVGGGFLKIPMMVLLFGISIEIAVGSSALMIGITAAGGFAGHVLTGTGVGRLCWQWPCFSVARSEVAARSAFPQKRLKRSFGWFLLAIAVVLASRLVWSP